MQEKKLKTFKIEGWVCVQVYATLKARNLREAMKIVENTHGHGNPDEFVYEEGNWCSPVEIESVSEV